MGSANVLVFVVLVIVCIDFTVVALAGAGFSSNIDTNEVSIDTNYNSSVSSVESFNGLKGVVEGTKIIFSGESKILSFIFFIINILGFIVFILILRGI